MMIRSKVNTKSGYAHPAKITREELQKLHYASMHMALSIAGKNYRYHEAKAFVNAMERLARKHRTSPAKIEIRKSDGTIIASDTEPMYGKASIARELLKTASY